MRRLLTILLLISSLSYGQRSSSKIGFFANTDSILYGYNGVMRFSALPLSNSFVLDSFKTLPLFDIFRYPGGTESNTFEWERGLPAGDFTHLPCLLTDLRVMLDSIPTVRILFNLNIVTATLDNQLEMLDSADRLGIVGDGLFELGNEINTETDSLAHTKFPTAQSYADTAAVWMAAIKARFPNAKVAFVGENKTWSKQWNDFMIAKNPDALIWHEGVDASVFVQGGVVDSALLADQVILDYETAGFRDVSLPIWPTEFNYKVTGVIDTIPTEQDKILASEIMLRTIVGLIQAGSAANPKIVCIRGIEGQNQGAFWVMFDAILRQATSYSMSLWEQNSSSSF